MFLHTIYETRVSAFFKIQTLKGKSLYPGQTIKFLWSNLYETKHKCSTIKIIKYQFQYKKNSTIVFLITFLKSRKLANYMLSFYLFLLKSIQPIRIRFFSKILGKKDKNPKNRNLSVS